MTPTPVGLPLRIYSPGGRYQRESYYASNQAVKAFRKSVFAYGSGFGRPSHRCQSLMIRQKQTKDHCLASSLLRGGLQEVATLAPNSREQQEGLIQTLESLIAKGERALRENRMERFARVN